MKLVLFDIDGTLISQPGSEVRFFHYLLKRRVLRMQQLSSGLLFVLANMPRYGRHVLRKNKAYLAGLSVDDVAALARHFVKEELSLYLIPSTLQRLRQSLAAGDCVVLLSGTPQFIADPLAEMLGAHAAIAALCARRGDRFAAKAPLRHPLGPSKVEAARAIALRYKLPLNEATAYGDSVNDALLFREVKNSVAIMPGRKLRKLALGEGWEILPG